MREKAIKNQNERREQSTVKDKEFKAETDKKLPV